MLELILAAAAEENPYGIQAALREGGIIAIATFAILVLMSVILPCKTLLILLKL